MMKLWPSLALRVLRKDDLLWVAGSSRHGGYALVMKLLVYHMILDLAMKSLSALTLLMNLFWTDVWKLHFFFHFYGLSWNSELHIAFSVKWTPLISGTLLLPHPCPTIKNLRSNTDAWLFSLISYPDHTLSCALCLSFAAGDLGSRLDLALLE